MSHNVTSSAKQAVTSLFNATTTLATTAGESIHMLADLAQAGRAHTKEISFAARVKEAARKPYIKDVVATEATVDLVKRKLDIQKELDADPKLKALYDSTFATISDAVKDIT